MFYMSDLTKVMLQIENGSVYTDFVLPYGSCTMVFDSGDCVLCYILYATFTAFQVPLTILNLY